MSSLLLLFSGCADHHDRDVFEYYANQMGLDISDNTTSVIIVPSMSCIGCRKAVAQYSKNIPQGELVVVSQPLSPLFVGSDVVIDSLMLCERLNWDYANIIEVFLTNGTLDSVRDYDAEQTISRFN